MRIHTILNLILHHLYRAMGFLGEELSDQKKASAFVPRCIMDAIEEHIFFQPKDLFKINEDFQHYLGAITESLTELAPFQGCET